MSAESLLPLEGGDTGVAGVDDARGRVGVTCSAVCGCKRAEGEMFGPDEGRDGGSGRYWGCAAGAERACCIVRDGRTSRCGIGMDINAGGRGNSPGGGGMPVGIGNDGEGVAYQPSARSGVGLV